MPAAERGPHDRVDFLLELATTIVSAYGGNNPITPERLALLIPEIYSALASVGPEVKPRRPAVAPEKSVGKSEIICLEDGLGFHTLRRHLRRAHGLTPDQYRSRWGLPADYPMVAANYSSRRAEIAKEMGLGDRRGVPAPASPTAKATAKRAGPRGRS